VIGANLIGMAQVSGLVPASPFDCEATWDDNGNVTITWRSCSFGTKATRLEAKEYGGTWGLLAEITPYDSAGSFDAPLGYNNIATSYTYRPADGKHRWYRVRTQHDDYSPDWAESKLAFAPNPAAQLVPRLALDEHLYYYERGSFGQQQPKIADSAITLTDTLRREEFGFEVKQFSYNIICLSRDEVDTLSGSFIKRSTDPRSPNYGKLRFIDQLGTLHEVYFDEMGPIMAIDRGQTIFRVPIKLFRTRTV